MNEKQQVIIKQLYDIQAIKFGDFTFKSGKKSSVYIDMRRAISYPALLELLAEEMALVIKKYHIDRICGVPYGAVPLATAISLYTRVPLIMARNASKEHGTKSLIEGEFMPGQQCILIEDVISTGGSVIETIERLQALGMRVQAVVAIASWSLGGDERIQQAGVFCHTLFQMPTIFAYLHEQQIIDEAMLLSINNWITQNRMSEHHV